MTEPSIQPTAGRVARSFLALGAGEAAARLIGFAATVYAARVLGPGGYGVIGVATAVVLYLNRVADLGFDLGLGVRELAADRGFLASTAPAVMGARLVVAAVLVLLATAVGAWLLPAPDGPALAVQALTLIAVGASVRWVHVAAHRAPAVGIAMAAGQAIMLALVVALVRDAGDLLAVPAAQAAGDLAAALALLVVLWRTGGPIRFRIDWRAIRPLLPRSLHLVASALLGIIIYNADFLFLRVLRDASAVGWYAAAYTLVTFFLNVGAMYNLSLLPSLTELRSDRVSQRALYHTATAHVFALGMPLALGGALLARPIVELVYGAGYEASTLPFALLVWCIPLNLLRDVPLMAVMAEGGERAVFSVTARAAVLNLALNVALIPPFGLAGAATATLATEVARMGLAQLEARRRGYALPSLGRFARPVAAAAMMAGALALARPESLAIGIALGAVAYAGAMVALGGVRWTPRTGLRVVI